MSLGDSAVGPPERLHPLFLLTGLGGSLRGGAGGYAAVGYLAVSGRMSTALLVGALLIAFLFVSLFLYWRRFEYRVGADEVRIDSGILSRTHRSIPFDRIQDVEISRGPIQRLLGLATVKFETGGSAASKEDEGVLRAIAFERAQELRTLVRTHRGAAGALAAEPEADGPRPPVFAMDLSRVLLAGLFNFSLALFGVLFGLTQTIGDVAGFDPLNRAFWDDVIDPANPIAALVLANQAAAIVAGLLVLVVIGVATGVVRSLLRDYGFRLERTDIGLRRRRGLLTRSDVTLPARRAQAAIVASGPVRDAFGWRELKLQSLARDEGGSGDHVLAPLAREDEIAAVLRELSWEPASESADWKRVSSAYVSAFAIGIAPLAAIAAANLLMSLPLIGAIGLALIAMALFMRWVAWRRTRYALDGDRLLIGSGWWRRRTLILPLSRMQSIELRQSFVARWFGVSSLLFGVAGGGLRAHEIPALPDKSARDLRAKLLSVAP